MTDASPPLRPPSLFRRHVATNTTDEPAVLIGLACDKSVMVRTEAAKNPTTPRWVLELLVRAGADPTLRGRRRIDPDMEPGELRRLVECGPWAQELVADHPNTGADVLDVLAGQPSARIRISVAGHRNTAGVTIARLCGDAEVDVRKLANRHPARPAGAYRLVRAVGADADLIGLERDAVSRSPETETLRAAADLGPWGVFLATRHPACPSDVLDAAARSADWRVRSGVLDNAAASAELVARAADVDRQGDETYLSEVESLRALSDPTTGAMALSALLDHPCPAVRLAVARHPAADARLLRRLASDESAEIRRAAAEHPLTDPSDIDVLVSAGSSSDLMRLAEPDLTLEAHAIARLVDGGRWAQQLAVRHPNTSAGTLARLLCADDGKIREWAAVHPAAPADVIEDIRRAGGADDFQGIAVADPEMPPDALRRVAALGPWGALVVSWHPNAPADLVGEHT